MVNLNETRLLLKLLEFDTQNSDDLKFQCDNFRILNFIKKLLSPTKAKIKIQEYYIYKTDGKRKIKFRRGNLVAIMEKGRNLPFVLLEGHIDTVPNGKNKIAVKGENIYGRGAVDMKGPLTAMLLAFIEISKLKNVRYNPVLLLTSEEETTLAGIKEFLKRNKQRIDFGICCEPTNFEIKNRFKGVIYETIEVFGKSGHGSTPYIGINAIEKAFPVIKNLIVFSKIVNKSFNNEFKSENVHSKYASMNIGKIEAGDKVNKIPSFCKIEYEIRPVKNVKFYLNKLNDMVIKKIEKNTKFKHTTVFAYNPMIVNKDNEFANKLSMAIKKNKKRVKFGVMNGFTEASILNIHKIKTVVFGPGKEKYAHSDNEQINTNDIKKFKNILIDFFKV